MPVINTKFADQFSRVCASRGMIIKYNPKMKDSLLLGLPQNRVGCSPKALQ